MTLTSYTKPVNVLFLLIKVKDKYGEIPEESESSSSESEDEVAMVNRSRVYRMKVLMGLAFADRT